MQHSTERATNAWWASFGVYAAVHNLQVCLRPPACLAHLLNTTCAMQRTIMWAVKPGYRLAPPPAPRYSLGARPHRGEPAAQPGHAALALPACRPACRPAWCHCNLMAAGDSSACVRACVCAVPQA